MWRSISGDKKDWWDKFLKTQKKETLEKEQSNTTNSDNAKTEPICPLCKDKGIRNFEFYTRTCECKLNS
jgi:hypothetical protein